MTSISFIAPYAPQPAVSALSDPFATSVLSVQPPLRSNATASDGRSTDQSGSGAGNGTGTGGALTGTLLDRKRQNAIAQASPRSVVEAQAKAEDTAAFLARQQEEQVRLRAEAMAEAARRAEVESLQRRAEEIAEARADAFRMPNPLPTAPILQTEDS